MRTVSLRSGNRTATLPIEDKRRTLTVTYFHDLQAYRLETPILAVATKLLALLTRHTGQDWSNRLHWSPKHRYYSITVPCSVVGNIIADITVAASGLFTNFD